MLLNKDKSPGLLPEEDLEKGFDRRVPVIYPTKSPVSAMSGESDVETPAPINTGLFSRLSKAIKKKLKPLLSAKKDMDDVYSKGYFERHYPDADENLKGLLHDHAMSSWAHAMNDEEEGEEESETTPHQLVVTININK